ncbi:uncharacterized protein EV420DRAFT_1499461 [Desarmillaria tabescens]|uniref:F-box domain-containing protein n=1 Tax=Armillaria tabescens TaxID=1929756 RepID=A0AA39NRH3_ARMTA|nr:uncharacterized protein EV420DRAFT_1499461 [Desarmillaria tabescens]KAK0470269.1 hypothetical protein EV420DRAFT_1499461 [Desarmillaria tabescens]
MSSSNSQEPPTDIFYEILLNSGVKDPSFLWITCRQVSRSFKDAVERVFVARHLKKTWLHIDAGNWYSPEHGKVFFAPEFKFSRLDPANLSRAIYRYDECHEDFRDELARRLRQMFRNGPSLERPRVIIQVRRSANDTMLPEFQSTFDPESNVFEISFDWKGMYSHFFREQKEVNRRIHDWVEGLKDEVKAVRNSPVVGDIGFGGYFMRIMDIYASNDNKTCKTIRSERIRRNVLENEGRVVSGQDDVGYQRVKEEERAIGWEDPYSDEEESEENEKDDADSEGDWETVDESSDEDGGSVDDGARRS